MTRHADIKATALLPEVIKLGLCYSTRPDRKGKHPAGTLFHHPAAPVSIDGGEYVVVVVVRDVEHQQITHNVWAKNAKGTSTPTAPTGETVDATLIPRDAFRKGSMEQIVSGGNSDDGPEQLLEAASPTIEEIDRKANKAATSSLNDLPEPNDKQKEAGNYKKGEPFRLHDLTIVIENPRGSSRKGIVANGEHWENRMATHYGDIKGTMGADGDPVDVFIGEHPESETVWVIDQVDPETREFDEHKVMLGFESRQQARRAYLDSYDKGWTGRGHDRSTN